MFKQLSWLALLGLTSWLSAGEIGVSMSNRGLQIGNFGEISPFSRFVAVDKGWTKHWFYTVTAPARFENGVSPEGDAYARMIQTQEMPNFKLNDYSAVVHDDTVTITLDGEAPGDEPGKIEYSMLFLPQVLINGSQYHWKSADGRSGSGRISVRFDGTGTEPIGENLTEFVIDGKAGKLALTLKKGQPFSVIDYRGVGFGPSDRVWPGIWIGTFSTFGGGERRFEHQLELKFDYVDGFGIAAPLPELSKEVRKVPEANLVSGYQPALPVLPTPQRLERTETPYIVGGMDKVVVRPGAASEQDAGRLKRAAEKLLLNDFVLPVTMAEDAAEFGKNITIEVTDREVDGVTAPEQPEGYSLKIGADGITIVSRTARGAFYGLQSLRSYRNSQGFDGVEVTDWPDFDFRSMLMMVDNGSLDYHGRQITELLAPLRYNTIIIETEYAAWDATKNIHQPWAISKDDLRKLIALANDNFIDVYPLFQTLGHCQWLFANGQNLDLAEFPSWPYAYNVSNPRTYELMTAILEEIINLYNHPAYVHIGHDEVTLGAPFPYREENKAIGGQKLVMDDIMFYYNYLKERGIGTMMWQDMFIKNSADGDSIFGLAGVRDQLPKDIIMCYWDYTRALDWSGDFVRMADEGFKLLGCTWYEPQNIANFTRLAAEKKALGMMATTWAGYTNSYVMEEKNFKQIAQYIDAACWMWNAEKGLPAGTSAGKALYDQMFAEPENKHASGIKFDLSNVANLELRPDSLPFLLEDPLDIDRLVDHSGDTGTVKFELAKRDGQLAAVALQSKSNPDFPAAVEGIQLNVKAPKLYFLHFLRSQELHGQDGEWSSGNKHIAYYKIHYADGSSVEVPVRFRRDIDMPESDYSKYMKPGEALEWQSKYGDTCRMWYMTFDNPYPDKEIRTLDVRGGEDRYPFYLFAISAEQ